MSVKISTDCLHYQKIGRSFFAFITDLPNHEIAERMSLVSHKTGNEIEVELTDTKRDNDNDIIGWEFSPVNDSRITKVVILND